jgi:hypothetical protein
MAKTDTTAPRPPSVKVVWFARIMEWLCWIGIFGALTFGLMGVFEAFPEGWGVTRSEEPALISATIAVNDPAAPSATAEVTQDALYRIAGLISVGLFVWALLSARRMFAGVGRGAYFARPTVLGLRNFALGVLLYLTLAQALKAAAMALYISRFEHGTYSLELALDGGLMLMLIFSGAVALVSTVMAHAASIEEENRLFV